jgi:AraC family transcriptional regulator of adaptative response/methylated-DNA-[protein]-cysteine methyltransferase
MKRKDSPPANPDRIRAACEYAEAHIDEPVRLEALAQVAGMSPFHFLRSFKSLVGVTPKRYVDEVRLKRLKTGLKHSEGVAAAVYDAGYGSASRVYERADSQLGMTPAQYRRGGQGVRISYASAETPVGLMMVGATDRGICFVQFGENSQDLLRQLRREYPSAEIAPMESAGDPHLAAWVAALSKHLESGGPHADLPLDVRATAFQMRVWTYLQSIPWGELQSYSEVAAGIGRPGAARAVARACASNVCAIVIPCHRVIRGTGELGGYKWGIGRKRTLIDRERTLARR